MLETGIERAWLDLTLAQRAVWFDAHLSASPSAYTLVRLARLHGDLDPAACREALKLVVARHDALRLRVDADLPRQWLHDAPETPFAYVDLSGEADPEAALRTHVAAAVARPMPLGDRPLFTLDVLRLGAREHAAFLRCHHLLVDEAAISLVLRHWYDAYRALTSDAPVELAAPTSYVAEIAADAAYAASDRFASDLAYWKGRFATTSPPLVERRAGATLASGERVHAAAWELDGEVHARFVAATAKAKTTPQRAIFALFGAVLARRYGRTDVTLGMALHRRNAATASVIGMMAGTIAVRLRMNADATLGETVRGASARIDEDLRRQRLPIDELARALGLSSAGLGSLFQVAVSYVPALRGADEIAGDVRFTLDALASREASPLTLHGYERASGDGIALDVAARDDFFDAGEAARIMDLLRRAVRRFVDEPACELERLPATTDAEREAVVTGWNATAAAFASGTADAFVAERARRDPGACAVTSATETLTYGDLDARANALAARLAANGIPPRAIVGVALERSASTVIALLGILKAGCAYLPLDVTYPKERLASLVADAAATAVVTDAAHADLVPGGIARVRIDEPALADDAATCDASVVRAHGPRDVAYVIYTSGSTGVPKGVAVPHAAAVNLAFARAAAHDPIGPGDRILAAISVGFDVSIGQLLLPLFHGATVVIASDLRTLSASDFWAFLAAERVTHVNSVPSFFESILDAVPADVALARVMLGGEPLSPALVRRLRAALPRASVFNMYGPTEACIDATFYATTGDETEPVLPIGAPLPNYRAYVLDAALEPVGIGVAGDLYLAGAGLAHGYLGDPARTAERFIADPFGAPGERLYRTGDRARRTASGALEFLGRDDAQVKIRGHRIELGEIEAALRAHPAVASAAVVASADGPGPARLVAYVVPRAGAGAPESAALRSALADRLPDYMIPAAFRTLDALPLTANGKLDERALPPVDWHSAAYVAPRTEREAEIAGLYAEVLGVRAVGAIDDFFELGGHSLLATRLVSLVRTRVGANLPLRAVFENPTVERFARYVDGAAARTDRAEAAPLAPLPRPDVPPLAFAQERLWFLSQLQADDAYNVPVAFRVRGAFDVERAVRAFERIVARHAALRTSIVLRDGRPVAVVREPGAFEPSRHDLRALADDARERALRDRVRTLASAPFDLARDLPLRIEIVTLAPNDRAIVAVAHHAAFDGWSAGVFLEEFARLYVAPPEAHAAALAPLAFDFTDFAVWQRARDFTDALAFFRERLAGAPARLELPADRVPAEGSRRPAARVRFALDAGTHAALLRVANANGASLFMALHAAFATLLARWSGQDDLVIGTAVANRPYAEFEPLVGCFVNTLALRTRLDRRATFARLLEAIREDDLAAFEHQGLPFERLVDVLQPERSLATTPLFQAMLVVQEAPPRLALPGLAVEALALDAGAAKFDLTLDVTAVRGGELAGTFEYAADTFDAATIARFAAQFERLLRAVAADPHAQPFALDLLDRAERTALVAAFNATAAAYPGGTADERFAEMAALHAGALAVRSDRASLSYADLHARANGLANVLRARGAGPGTVVAVALERSVETVVALLAILEAGAAYLPLDPSYPPERLAYMLADARAALAIARAETAALLPAGVPLLRIDEPGAAGEPCADPPPRLHGPRDVAYVIYTSGSTGMPKGVAVPHAAAVNLAYARRAHDPIGPGDRILAAISVGFDVSIGQLLLPLLAGACVAVADDLRSYTPQQFWAFLERHGVTHVNSVPSFFESVLAAAPPRSTLVRLMLGGEALTTALARRLRRALPHAQIYNMYGPTEACIDATCSRATGTERGAFVPIGRPLPNYRAYVLDERLEPAGTGIVGDLYLGGAGLAHGYIGAPALTAERFIADPFGEPGDRLYRTGDRARVTAEGVLEFFGRADAQVKLRGHRIELGEIEARLLARPGVREAVATVREDAPGDPRLVAYYTADDGLDAQALRDALLGALPSYMVPAAYVRLDAFPLTANGKVDRRALPEPGADAFPVRAYEAPQGEAETLVAETFATVLGIERAGRHDDFFELGGHSLLAMAVIDRARASGLQLDVRDLFTAPTVAGLAASARDAAPEVAVPPNGIPADATALSPEMLTLVDLEQREIDAIVARVPGGARNVADIYPLAPLQEGMLFHHVMTERGDAYLTPFVLGFETRASLEGFLAALRGVIARHDILRTAIVWSGLPAAVQVVLREAELPVETVELDVPPGGDAVRALRERYDPRHYRIDLGRAPLMRAFVAHDAANGRELLLLLSHHLVLDHTSLEVVLREIAAIAGGAGDALPEPEPFRTFVARARLGISQAEHEAFFRALLGDVDEPTAPFGLTGVVRDGGEIREASLALDAERSHALRARARALGIGPATLFHLAWALVLAHASGRDDVVFGTLLFGRMQSGGGTRPALGMFINTLPMRVTLDRGASVEAALRATQRTIAELVRHEHASLALAQRCSGVPAPAPLFSALFNYRQSPPGDGAFGGVAGAELLAAQERTDYPLALAIDDRGDDFLITAQCDAPLDPHAVCALMKTASLGLLAALERSPDAPLRSVPVLDDAAYEGAVVRANRTHADYPRGTLHELFAAQAARTPDAVAVTDGAQTLTYAELAARVEALADVLAAHGVRRGDAVGVALPRSVATVVSLFAILEAGGAYLPLDPAYPHERLAHAVADAGARLVLTTAETANLASEAVATLDIADALAERAPARTRPHSDPNDVAYVIYTSGSTGTPKGVAVPHAAAVNLAFARRVHDPIGPGDRVLAAISVGFDVSLGQLALPLLSGAAVVIAGDLRTYAPRDFWAFLGAQRVTHVNSVPSFFESVLGAAPPDAPLVRLMLGGEALSSALVRRLRAALPNATVVNMYGPTEACIDATCYVATGAESGAFLPIGAPLPNYRAYVLDAALEPVADGVAGDLYLAGAGLAHGYVGAPALTAERFVADPFGGPGERIYRTGDRARRTAAGLIEFLGRADTQVKIRGHRVELGEIEARLATHPGIGETVALVREDVPGDPRLVAYYVAAQPLATESLRAVLAGALPEYMVPAAFVRIDALPLTPNGKLDRAALPAPDAGAYAARPFVAPHGETEETIARIFAEVVRAERVGRHDDFFERGGHSLLAMTLIERLRADGIHIDVRDLFVSPTVAGLAAAARAPDALVEVPTNVLAPGSATIEPGMLPLVRLTADEIARIVARVPGGAPNVQDVYPLAPLQEGILFRHLMTERGDAYLAPFLLGFAERDRLDAFLEAMREMVARHDILRTAILWDGLPEPVQVVLRHAELPVEELELSLAPHADAAAALRERFDSRHYRIDVGRAPMLRAFVARDAANGRWLLLLLSHHLILDHASLEVILHEVSLVAAGRRDALPPVTPFRDYIARTRLGTPLEVHEAFFRAKLGDVVEPTLPYGLAAVRGDGAGIREGSVVFGGAFAKRVRERARALGVGPAAILHLAWALVLAHTATRRDVVFGTLLFGRMHGGGARTLGVFINTLPLRVTIDETDVASAVVAVHRELAELLRHEHASLALAARCSGVPAPAPLFSALFNFRQSPPGDGAAAWPGVELLFKQERTDYPVSLAVDDRTDDFLVSALTDDPVDPNDVCALMETAVRNLLDALDASAGEGEGGPVALSAIGVVPETMRARELTASTGASATYPRGTLYELFAEQAARTPRATAVTDARGSLAYADLHARADAFARVLAGHGVSRGSVVGVALERSIETVVAFFAIARIGGVYLPLDVAYPAERLAFTIADAGAACVVAHAGTRALLPEAVRIVDPHETLATNGAAPPAADVMPNDTAYVVYTSGSTGRPKGVAVSHAAAVNLAFARRAHDPIGEGDRVLAAISVGFDVSIGQLALPLLSGATVVIASDVRALSAHEFWDFIVANGVTHVNSVPSFFESILDDAPAATPLVRVMLGGEALSGALVRRLSRALPGTSVVNMYGPTEACIDATCHVTSPDDERAVLPIGAPLPNYRAYVLDARLEPVATGVAADLYLAGAGLAHGYAGRAALTAERFIADPFGAPGTRMYHTGDRARRTAAGHLEFLGRADSQVKIRGHRVELGEIEAALRAHPGVAAAAVVTETNRAGATLLAAYVVPHHADATRALDPAGLRAHLAERLPDYMVPAAYATLAELPLTANGKLDRAALPALARTVADGMPTEPPRTETERAMLRIWANVLGVEPSGRDDDFFALGGHSLAAIRLMTACGAHFGRKLPLRVLFERPTIAGLSAAIDGGDEPSGGIVVPLRASGTQTPLFAIHPAGGHVFCYLPLVNALPAWRPVYGLQARAIEDDGALAPSIEALADDYLRAIRAVQPAGPYRLLGMSSGGLIAFEIARRMHAADERVEALTLLDTSVPGANPPFTEAMLVRGIAEEFGVGDLIEGSDDTETVAALITRARAAGRLPDALDGLAERVAAVYRNTVRVCEAYRPAPWNGPFRIVRALRRDREGDAIPDWSPFAAQAETHDLDCTHGDLMSERLASKLAALIEPPQGEPARGTD
jgi:amino acid adenylation domain-containing protein